MTILPTQTRTKAWLQRPSASRFPAGISLCLKVGSWPVGQDTCCAPQPEEAAGDQHAPLVACRLALVLFDNMTRLWQSQS